MSLAPDTLTIILVMTLGVVICRHAGFWFMRFVPMTPAVKAGLDAIPLAVMLGIIVPPALRGGVPEVAGVLAAGLAVHLRGNDLVSVLAGMGAVAALRAMGL